MREHGASDRASVQVRTAGWCVNYSGDELAASQQVYLRPSDAALKVPHAGVLSGGSCCDTEGVHLLSIFPLHGGKEFARLSCVAVSEPVTPCGPPFCASRRQLLTLLLKVLPTERVQAILSELDQKREVQLSITDADAREVGFLARIM